MRVIYIYNQHSKIERDMLDRVRQELPNYVTELEIAEVNEVKDKYPIRATPALIFIRDDLQGKELLSSLDGELRLIAEVYKAMDEEDKNIHAKEINRIDHIIRKEKDKLLDELVKANKIDQSTFDTYAGKKAGEG